MMKFNQNQEIELNNSQSFVVNLCFNNKQTLSRSRIEGCISISRIEVDLQMDPIRKDTSNFD